MPEFITFARGGGELVIVRKDSIRFVEPHGEGVLVHIDGIGAIATKTFDIFGMAGLVFSIEEPFGLDEVA